MRKALALILLITLFVACGRIKPQLNILTWPDSFDPQLIAEFERQHGCKVVFDYFDDDSMVVPKLSGGGGSVYDIACLGNHTIGTATHLNLLAPLRHENLPNLRNLAPEFINLEFDPGNRFSIPWGWGYTGLFARVTPNTTLEETWGLIFDPAKQPGPFILVDEITSCLGAALRYKGYSVNTTNAAELKEARDLLIDAKKRSLGFQFGTNTRNRVLSGEAVLVMTWNGNLGRLLKENPGTVFLNPREGASYGVDSLCIMAGAPNRELAEKFLNYLMIPEVAARTALTSETPTPNKAARSLLPQDVINNPAIYPSPQVMRSLELNRDLGEANKLRNEIWTQIKAK